MECIQIGCATGGYFARVSQTEESTNTGWILEPPMRMQLFACLWPGLPGIWNEAKWQSLISAMLFAALLNSLLIVTFRYPEALSPLAFRFLWFATAAWWGLSAWGNWRLFASPIAMAAPTGDDDSFLRAQAEYLRGHWLEAETILEEYIETWPHDADAHLMLATLYRHTRRLEEARSCLKRLAKLPLASRWAMEIDREWERIEETASESSEGEISERAQAA